MTADFLGLTPIKSEWQRFLAKDFKTYPHNNLHILPIIC